MTPPLCAWCKTKPVKAYYVGTAKGGGKRWRKLCSRQCAGEYAWTAQSEDLKVKHAQNLVAFNRRAHVSTAVRVIREALGADFAGGSITLAQAVALYRKAYRRGYFTGYRAMSKQEVA